MTIFIIILLFVILFWVMKRKQLDVTSKVLLVVYYLLWLLALVFSQFGFRGLDIPSNKAIVILCIGVVFFSLGFYAIKLKPAYAKYDVDKLWNSVDTLFNNILFRFLIIVLSVYILSLLITYIQTVFISHVLAAAEVRSMDSEETARQYGPLFATIKTFLFVWLIPILRTLFCYGLLCKRNWILIPMAILLLGYESLLSGRFGYVRTFMPMLLVFPLFFSSNNRLRISTKQVLIFSSIVLGVYFLLSVMTGFRMNTTDSLSINSDTREEFEKQMISYSVGPTVAFDYALEHNYVNNIGGFKYGEISFFPLIWPVEMVLYYLGVTKTVNPGRVEYSSFIQDNIVYISSEFSWNALYTWNLDFYCDYGLLGVLFFNFLFGLLFGQSTRLVYKHCTVWAFIICAWFVQIIIQSPIKLSDLSSFFTIVCFILLLLDQREYKKDINRAIYKA